MIDNIAELEPSATSLISSHENSVERATGKSASRFTAAAVAMSALSLGLDSFSFNYLYSRARYLYAERRFVREYNVRYPEDPISKQHSLVTAQAVVELEHIYSELNLQ